MEQSIGAHKFSCCLNSPSWLPEAAYRRNSGIYPLVCYVNTVLGACLSENYVIAALSIARAADHMMRISPSAEEERYYALVAGYFAHVINHIRLVAPHVAFDNERVPASLLSGTLMSEPAAVVLDPIDANGLYFWRSSR